MSAIDLSTLKRLTSELEAANTGLQRAKRLLSALEMQDDRRGIILSLTTHSDTGGDKEPYEVRLIECDRYRGPAVTKGREPLLAHMRRLAQEQVIAWSSKVEGIQFQIRKLAGGAA